MRRHLLPAIACLTLVTASVVPTLARPTHALAGGIAPAASCPAGYHYPGFSASQNLPPGNPTHATNIYYYEDGNCFRYFYEVDSAVSAGYGYRYPAQIQVKDQVTGYVYDTSNASGCPGLPAQNSGSKVNDLFHQNQITSLNPMEVDITYNGNGCSSNQSAGFTRLGNIGV